MKMNEVTSAALPARCGVSCRTRFDSYRESKRSEADLRGKTRVTALGP